MTARASENTRGCIGADLSPLFGMRSLMIVAGTLGIGLLGCTREAPAKPVEAPGASMPSLHLSRAQPKLPVLKLGVGSAELVAEVARTSTELATGMMFRTNLAEGEAMLFVFARPFRASFYMKNTTVPLDCAYLDSEGAIQEIHALKPLDETPVESQSSNIQYVLETPHGWFQRHEIRPGMVVATAAGPLPRIDWTTLRPARSR